MILTSYFANTRNIPNNIRKISISRFKPSWSEVTEEYLGLAPSKNLLFKYKNENLSEEDYEKIYREETLSKLNPLEVYNQLKNSVLLCYEKSEDFCHRGIVSSWLNEHGLYSFEFKKHTKIYIEEDSTYTNYEEFKNILSRLLSYSNLVTFSIKSKESLAVKYANEFNIDYSLGNNDIDLELFFWNGTDKLIFKDKNKSFVYNVTTNKFIKKNEI